MEARAKVAGSGNLLTIMRFELSIFALLAVGLFSGCVGDSAPVIPDAGDASVDATVSDASDAADGDALDAGDATAGDADAVANATVKVTFAGTSTGSVTLNPGNVTCTTTCTVPFPPDTAVSIVATADVGGTFTGWSSPCTAGDAANDCQVTAVGAVEVTATFTCSAGGSQTFTPSGAIDTFKIPVCATSLIIDAYGAQGGFDPQYSTTAGGGAHIKGTFAALSGTLHVIVGKKDPTSAYPGGGGGASFVYVNATDALPLIAAAGGGGATCNASGGPGSATTSPTNSTTGDGNGAGGSNGNGGTGGGLTGNASDPGTGGGGAGWLTNGGDGTVVSKGGGGQAPRNGGTGGTAGAFGHVGGFGGGGGSAGSCGAGGGGGGFNGGGGGNNWNGSATGAGGGGGSYNGGTNQTNTAGGHAGDGSVTISW